MTGIPQPPGPQEYQVVVRDLPEQPIVSIRERHPQTQIPAFLGSAFGDLFSHLKLLGVEPAGAPFVIYHALGPDVIDAEVCVPVTKPVTASGRTQMRVLPAATVAHTLHLGPYEELEVAYAAVNDWIARNGFEAAGPIQERYLNGPGEAATPADYQTELEIPVVAAAAPALV
ncbi:MAG TPA: GyrI-like domain-containing protein [Candidatus Limnocylindrales bacterium]|nr:GyrI-like domain-containing protein [Candidatus Limnocylindrales bacterium]